MNRDPLNPNNSKPVFPPGILPLTPEKRAEIPAELKELDGAPIAAFKPGENSIEGEVIRKPSEEPATTTEFNLHADGTVMKYIERPGFAPHQLLCDGAGRQYGIARNAAVADLICNGVNALHLARVQMDAEEKAAQGTPGNPGGVPNLIIRPHIRPEIGQ